MGNQGPGGRHAAIPNGLPVSVPTMRARPDSETILVMLSGGIDSAYLLYDYLLNTDLPVHAHHISTRFPHDRWRAEDPAAERVVEWCRSKLRSFEYSTSRFDLDLPSVGWDSDLQLLVASKVALNLGATRVTLALGWSADDLDIAQIRDRIDRRVVATHWHALCQSAYRHAVLNEEIATPLVERGMSKQDVVSALPSELVSLTWSCRRPVFTDSGPRPCDECHACLSRLAATGQRIELHAPRSAAWGAQGLST
jgi:7-cyano-7-deazaguanine synthase in queuosine biosynthesis